MTNCMICDLYAVIDKHLDGDTADFVADLVTVLPPRGHAFHKLDVWQRIYRSKPASSPNETDGGETSMTFSHEPMPGASSFIMVNAETAYIEDQRTIALHVGPPTQNDTAAERIINLDDYDTTTTDNAVITLQMLTDMHSEPHRLWRAYRKPGQTGAWNYEKA